MISKNFMIIFKLFKFIINNFNNPFILLYNYYEHSLIKNKKIRKILIKYEFFYTILEEYKKLPKLKSKYFLINYYKLKIIYILMQVFYILKTLDKLRIHILSTEHLKGPLKIKFTKNKKNFDKMDYDCRKGVTVEIYYRK